MYIFMYIFMFYILIVIYLRFSALGCLRKCECSERLINIGQSATRATPPRASAAAMTGAATRSLELHTRIGVIVGLGAVS